MVSTMQNVCNMMRCKQTVGAQPKRPERLRFAKGLAIATVVTSGLLGGSFKIWAEEAAPTISLSDASCNDDAVREMLVSRVVRPRGINNPVLGQAHVRGECCEIMVSTRTGKEVGHIHYRAFGYKSAPVLRVEPLTDWPAK
jgi:hypothetical protein